MANEGISHFLKNMAAGQLQESNNANLSGTLQSVQMQLSNTSSIVHTGNMGKEMANLKQSDQQQAA